MSTFSGIYTALRAIQNAQSELQVTGQNMSNVNTDGYTRQRLDSVSVGSDSSNMRYASTNVAIGGGVLATGVSQLRDPYLDIRYRSENAKVGDTDNMVSTMTDIASVFDEVDTDGLEAQMKDLVTQLQGLCGDSGSKVSESTVKTAAAMLVNTFNNYSVQLSSIRDQQTGYLNDNAINKANQLLSNIAHLNGEIKQSDISGSSALELKDQRNTMIDELSQYMNIEVKTTSVSIGADRTVDELSINLVGAKNNYTLLSNTEYGKFSFEAATGTPVANIKFTDSTGTTTNVNDELSTGVFHGYLKMLNDNGEYDAGKAVLDPVTGNPTGAKTDATEHGIGYYEKCLDTLASKFASVLNAANSTTTENKPLFASSVSGKAIAAGNISLSTEWQTAKSNYITNTKQTSGVDNSSTATDNILAIIKDFSTDIEFKTDDGVSVFTGNLEEFVSNLSTTLGLEQQNIKRQNKAYSSTLSTIDKQRLSVSSVDNNQEGVNLVMYNQSMTAACRFMTTLDEALDNIISKMGVIGR